MTAITTPQFSVLDEHRRKPDLNGVAAAVQAAPRYVEIRREEIAAYKASGMQVRVIGGACCVLMQDAITFNLKLKPRT